MIERRKMGLNLNERIVKVILPNMLGYERIAMASLASFAKMYDYPPKRIEDLKTVVSEAAIKFVGATLKVKTNAAARTDAT